MNLRHDPPPYIAVEGLDGSGKSTVARLLASRLGAALVKNPPDSLSAERAVADAGPEGERRAFYVYGNGVAAREAVLHRSQGRAVVMDRCAASTLAFRAAQAGAVAQPRDWPADVGRPDRIILLDVPEPVRLARIASRAAGETPEEARLRKDDEFRARVLAGYVALGAVVVWAQGPPEEVIAAILRLIETGATP